MSNDDMTELQALFASLSAETRERWDRDLPFTELLSDRWERARSLDFGEGSSIYAESYVYGSPRVGRNVWIGPFTLIDGTGGLSIGDGSTISAGVHIYTHDTVVRTLSGGKSAIDRSPVSIGSRVYVGPQSVIARGVNIGDMCVIGARSFVNRNVPSHTVVVGTPGRAIGRVILKDNGEVAIALDSGEEPP